MLPFGLSKSAIPIIAVVRNGLNAENRHTSAGNVERHLLQRATLCSRAHTLVLRSGPRFWKRRSGGPLRIRRSSHLPAMDARSAIAVCSSCGIRSYLRSRVCASGAMSHGGEDVVEADETYVRSQKGVRNLALMPVQSPQAWHSRIKRGLASDEQICICAAGYLTQDRRSDREIREPGRGLQCGCC